MSTLADPPRTRAPHDQAADPEALIEEARARQRRRHQRVVGLVAAAALVASAVIWATRDNSTPAIVRVPGGPTVDVAAFAGHGRLAFVSHDSVWVLDGGRRSLRRIPTAPGLHPLAPAFSRDGHWLAFVETSFPPADVAGGASMVGRLWLARGDGSDPHAVAGLADAQLVGWSPSSDVLAVVAGPISKRVPFGVQTTVRLVTPAGAVHRLLRARYVRGAVWSPDGRRLAVVTEDAGLHDTLAAYSLEGGRPAFWQRFTPLTRLNGMTQILVDPAGWWHGFGIGLWVYGNGMTRNNDATPLDLVAAPGAAPRFIAATLSDRTTPVVAAANERLAVVADVSHGVNGGRLVWDAKQLQVCTPTGPCKPIGAARRTVTLDPAWSPKGERLAFVEAPDLISSGWQQPILRRWYRNHTLRVFDNRTGTVTKLAADRGATVPVWSADGNSMLFVDDNGLSLLPRQGGKPIAIARPLFGGRWPSYFGQMAWSAQFAWASG